MRFRFLDRVMRFDPDGAGRIITVKTFTRTEEYLTGPFHEPREVPSSLILETMANSGGRLVYLVSGSKLFGLMARVEEARFPLPVVAGEKVMVASELMGMQDPSGETIGLAKVASRASVGAKTVADARIVFLCVPAKGFERQLVNSEKSER